jgi:hypothetical protein
MLVLAIGVAAAIASAGSGTGTLGRGYADGRHVRHAVEDT